MNGLFLNAICEYLSDHGTAFVQIGEATPVCGKAGFQDLTNYPADATRITGRCWWIDEARYEHWVEWDLARDGATTTGR